MDGMAKFDTNFGDYNFSCVRERDGTYTWSKRLLNTAGAAAEAIGTIEDVPVEVLRSFSRTQVAAQSGRLS